jgi:hypothetical protein
MASSDLPLYVEHSGEQAFPAPIKLEGTHFFSFLFEADAGALRALCDQRLNGPAQGHVEYHPLVPRVLFACADIQRLQCQLPPFSNRGWMKEIDIAFWVPVVAVKRVAGVQVAERVAWFQPYLFVNDSIAVASGREVFGFPKAFGQFQIPQSFDDPARFTVDALAVEHFGPNPSQARVQRVLELRRVDGAIVEKPQREWGGLQEAFRDIMSMIVGSDGTVTLPGLGLVLQLFDFLTHRDVPLVFLKQFRDVCQGDRACYQAIIEAPATLVAFRGGGELRGKYAIQINALDTFPLVRDLGLKGPEQEAIGAWYTDFDFIMGTGREVWRAATAR